MALDFHSSQADIPVVHSNKFDQVNLAEATFPARILIASDTYPGQVNGVELSIEETKKGLTASGHSVASIKTHPEQSIPLPGTPEVRVTWPHASEIREFIDRFAPHCIHIATEGPVGFQVRAYCLKNKFEFTTSFHTLWPEYAREHFKVPRSLSWKILKWYHGAAEKTLTRSNSMVELLTSHGFKNVHLWHGGVNLDRFSPQREPLPPLVDLRGRPVDCTASPVLLYVGRVSKEKNLEAFLSLQDLPGTKIVVGDGQALPEYINRYPEVHFMGAKKPEDLPAFYQLSDVFVFPSRTDTFGRVIIEALACGTPVAAFPVTGPRDIITSRELGALDENLSVAIQQALQSGKPEACVQRARHFSLQNVLKQFVNALVPVNRSFATTARPSPLKEGSQPPLATIR